MKSCLSIDQNVVRETLALALSSQPGVEVLVQAETASEALGAAELDQFDVAVVEFALPDRTGAEVIRQLKATGDTHVLVLSMFRDEFSVGEAMRAGADGYLSKRARLLIWSTPFAPWHVEKRRSPRM